VSGSQRAAADAPEATERADADRRWRLEDERDFLVRSLADLRAEREAGDIETRDYEALLGRDSDRLASVEAELGELDEAERARVEDPEGVQKAPPRARRRRRAWLGVVAAVALSAGTTLLVVHVAAPRLPGQPETGSIKQNLAQQIETQLAEASVLVDDGTTQSLGQALTLYKTVLGEDPKQPQALAETGWLEWEAGEAQGDTALEDAGRTLVSRSIGVERDDFAAHLFMGTIDLEQSHDPAAAVAQYKLFLAEDPPKTEISSAASLITQAYTELGQPVPAKVTTS
jgi:hypothetical protein